MKRYNLNAFRRYGRVFHYIVETGDDMRRLLELDEAHWIATSAPMTSFRADATLLELLDIDKDNRIKAREFKKAVRWTLEHLQDARLLEEHKLQLSLKDLNQDSPNGKALTFTLKRLCRNVNKPEVANVSLEEVRTLKKELKDRPISDAGVVLPDACEDEEVRALISDIIRVEGGSKHPNGPSGVGEKDLQRFLTQSRAYLDWRAQGIQCRDVMCLGDQTHIAYKIFSQLREKITRFFVQSEALILDPSLKSSFWPRNPDQPLTNPNDIAELQAMMIESPVAEPVPEKMLRLNGNLNPAYATLLRDFFQSVAQPLLHKESSELNTDDWTHICQTFKPYQEWTATRPLEEFVLLKRERLEHILNSDLPDQVRKLIQRRKASLFSLDHVCMLEKLILFRAHLMTLANNFVSFPHLYDPKQTALFEEGVLIMDGRRFRLAVRVLDRQEHLKIASAGAMFIMYVEIEHRPTLQKYEIAIPVTSGTQGNIIIGKRGIFHHVDGREWTAKVTHVVDQPVSLREAMWDPFKRLGKALMSKVENITAGAEKNLENVSGKIATQAQETTSGKPLTAPPPSQSSAPGLLAGGGIAIAALGSSLAFITKILSGMNFIQIFSGLLAAVMAVLIPTAIIAAIRLHHRDLSGILEGSGWAINARMRLTRAQRLYFTQRPQVSIFGKRRQKPPGHGLTWL